MFTIGMDGNYTLKTYKYLISVYNVITNKLFLMFKFILSLVLPYFIPLNFCYHSSVVLAAAAAATQQQQQPHMLLRSSSSQPNQFLISDKNIVVFSENEIKEIIFGCLLGDGSLDKSLKSKNVRFKFSQSIKAKDYFLELYSIFKPARCGRQDS